MAREKRALPARRGSLSAPRTRPPFAYPLLPLPARPRRARRRLCPDLVRLVPRGQARKSAASAARNIGEAAGRPSSADRTRIFGIARGEVVEVMACVEVANALGQCSEADVNAVCDLAGRVSAMLARLMQ